MHSANWGQVGSEFNQSEFDRLVATARETLPRGTYVVMEGHLRVETRAIEKALLASYLNKKDSGIAPLAPTSPVQLTAKTIKLLNTGDVIRHKGQGNAYTVLYPANPNQAALAVRTVKVSSWQEWELIKQHDWSKDEEL